MTSSATTLDSNDIVVVIEYDSENISVSVNDVNLFSFALDLGQALGMLSNQCWVGLSSHLSEPMSVNDLNLVCDDRVIARMQAILGSDTSIRTLESALKLANQDVQQALNLLMDEPERIPDNNDVEGGGHEDGDEGTEPVPGLSGVWDTIPLGRFHLSLTKPFQGCFTLGTALNGSASFNGTSVENEDKSWTTFGTVKMGVGMGSNSSLLIKTDARDMEGEFVHDGSVQKFAGKPMVDSNRLIPRPLRFGIANPTGTLCFANAILQVHERAHPFEISQNPLMNTHTHTTQTHFFMFRRWLTPSRFDVRY